MVVGGSHLCGVDPEDYGVWFDRLAEFPVEKSVSYTHLNFIDQTVIDVLYAVIAFVSNPNHILHVYERLIGNRMTVSYTHLDVYKRQAMSNAQWPLFSIAQC